MVNKNPSLAQDVKSIQEGINDPVYDAEEMREYMDKWDGQAFVDTMCLSRDKDVLCFINR